MRYLLRYSIPFTIYISVLNILLSRLFCLSDLCVINKGIGLGIPLLYETFFISLLSILILYLGFKSKGILKVSFISVGILGLGNLISRILFNGVADYIHIFNLSLNIVDIFLVIYLIISALSLLFQKESK